jgi:hypothetical protein
VTVDVSAIPDAETLVIQYLASVLGDGYDVASDMPVKYGDTTPIRPFVWINSLPGDYSARTWQGATLVTWVTLDFDGFDTEHDGRSARINAGDVARSVCAVMPGITKYVSEFGQAVRVECYTPAIRPDWNDRVRRYGATMQVWAKAAQSAG